MSSDKTSKTRTRTTAIAVAAGGSIAALALSGRRRFLGWGATDTEIAARQPGDDLIGDPNVSATRAITIRRSTQAARTKTLSKILQRLGNFFVIRLLRSPLHRLLSGSLLLISFQGRRSGRRYTIPVMYAEGDRTLTVFVGHPERKTWWRSVRDGAEVEVRLRGHRLHGQAAVTSDAAVARTYLERYPRAQAAIESVELATFIRIAGLRVPAKPLTTGCQATGQGSSSPGSTAPTWFRSCARASRRRPIGRSWRSATTGALASAERK